MIRVMAAGLLVAAMAQTCSGPVSTPPTSQTPPAAPAATPPASPPAAPPAGASTLVRKGHLTYVGAFRLPAGPFGSVNGFNYSVGPIAYDPAVNGLFVGGHPYEQTMVAEVTIPAPVDSNDVTQLPFADVRQPFVDITEGHWADLSAGQTAYLGGLLVNNDTLYGTGYIYYDATSSQTVSHFAHSTSLATASFRGFSALANTPQAGYVAGWMTNVPDAWRALVGAPVLTGQCCIPITGRTSLGPAAFGIDPSAIAAGATIASTPFAYYSLTHPTLGPWDASNATYGGATAVGGMAAIAGSRSVLYFGSNGTGPFCYGDGTSDPSLAGKPTPGGTVYCYDPATAYKGPHAFPYTSQVWAYDLNDFGAAKKGSKLPWQIVPYATWTFQLPFDEGDGAITSVAYDPTRQLIYLLQPHADRDNEAYRPLIHVFSVNLTGAASTATGVAALK